MLRRKREIELPPNATRMSEVDIEHLIRLGFLVRTNKGIRIAEVYKDGSKWVQK